MSQDHGPDQNASPLTVSKVAGDQSLARAAALVLSKSSGSAWLWKAGDRFQFCEIWMSKA